MHDPSLLLGPDPIPPLVPQIKDVKTPVGRVPRDQDWFGWVRDPRYETVFEPLVSWSPPPASQRDPCSRTGRLPAWAGLPKVTDQTTETPPVSPFTLPPKLRPLFCYFYLNFPHDNDLNFGVVDRLLKEWAGDLFNKILRKEKLRLFLLTRNPFL